MKRMRVGLLLVLGLPFPGAALAAEAREPEPPGRWKFGSTLGLNLSQSAFSANWAGGDRGSLVWVLTTRSGAERQITRAFRWSNKLDLAYGQTAKQVEDASGNGLRWDPPDKTTDAIAFEALARWTLGGLVDPYAALGAESQFQDQSDPRGAIALNPVKLKESAGVARRLFRTADGEALTRLGVAFRQAIAKSFRDPLGRDQARFTSNDGGIEWRTDLRQPVLERKVLYEGTLLVYQPVLYSKSRALEDVDAALRAADPGREAIAGFWKTADLNLLNTFTAQITKHLGVNLTVQWVYDRFDAAALVDPALASSTDPVVRAAYAAQVDKNVRKAGQFREVLALALSYQLF